MIIHLANFINLINGIIISRRMKNGLFIVIDGIDGSGKSKIAELLEIYLRSENKWHRILSTREPTDGNYGKKIREMLRNDKDPISNRNKLMDLFVKDREEHLRKNIVPFLQTHNKKGSNIVICDRYYYSTIAFQGAQGLSIKEIIDKNKAFRKPDITFILDVEPSIALQRISYRKKEKFERLIFMKRIREKFLKLPELLEDNIKIIDASKPSEGVLESIKLELDMFLP